MISGNRHILIILALSALLSSCGIFKNKTSKTDSLTFQERTRFNELYFEASKLKVLGDFTGAGSKFAEALKVNPKSHAAMYQMANLNMGLRSFHEAIYWAERSVANNPTYNFWYYGQLAQAYNKVKEFEKSASTFKTMIDKEPERASNYIEAANQFINSRNFKQSLQILGSYQKRFGVDEESARKKEGIYFEMDKPKDAVHSMVELVNANPGVVRYQGLLAESYIRAHALYKALEVYDGILKQEPENGFAYFGKADVYRKMGKMDLSFENLLKAFGDKNLPIDLKLQVIGTYYTYVRVDEKMQDQALQLCDKLILTHITDPDAYVAQGDILYASGYPEKAHQSLVEAVTLDPSDIQIWRKMLSISDEIGNYKWIAEDSKKALEFFPNHTFLYIINAYANYVLEDYNGAIASSEIGLEISVLDEDRIDLLTTLADACHVLELHEKSDDAFDELLELSPDNHLALNNYSYYLSLRNTKLTKALTMIDKALTLQPNEPTYWDTKGWILYQMERYSEALPLLQKAFNKMNKEPEVVEHYAKALIKTGNVVKGEELLKLAKELQDKLTSGNP